MQISAAVNPNNAAAETEAINTRDQPLYEALSRLNDFWQQNESTFWSTPTKTGLRHDRLPN